MGPQYKTFLDTSLFRKQKYSYFTVECLCLNKGYTYKVSFLGGLFRHSSQRGILTTKLYHDLFTFALYKHIFEN